MISIKIDKSFLSKGLKDHKGNKIIIFHSKREQLDKGIDMFNQKKEPKLSKLLIQTKKIKKKRKQISKGFTYNKEIKTNIMNYISKQKIYSKIKELKMKNAEKRKRKLEEKEEKQIKEQRIPIVENSVVESCKMEQLKKYVEELKEKQSQNIEDSLISVKISDLNEPYLTKLLSNFLSFNKIQKETLIKLRALDLLLITLFLKTYKYIENIDDPIEWTEGYLNHLRSKKRLKIRDVNNFKFNIDEIKEITVLKIALRDIYTYIFFKIKNQENTRQKLRNFFSEKNQTNEEIIPQNEEDNTFKAYLAHFFHDNYHEGEEKTYLIDFLENLRNIKNFINEKMKSSPRMRGEIKNYCSYEEFKKVGTIVDKYNAEIRKKVFLMIRDFKYLIRKKPYTIDERRKIQISELPFYYYDLEHFYSFYELMESIKIFWKRFHPAEYNKFPMCILEQHSFDGLENRNKHLFQVS